MTSLISAADLTIAPRAAADRTGLLRYITRCGAVLAGLLVLYSLAGM